MTFEITPDRRSFVLFSDYLFSYHSFYNNPQAALKLSPSYHYPNFFATILYLIRGIFSLIPAGAGTAHVGSCANTQKSVDERKIPALR